VPAHPALIGRYLQQGKVKAGKPLRPILINVLSLQSAPQVVRALQGRIALFLDGGECEVRGGNSTITVNLNCEGIAPY